ncbi:hypothetical protein JCM10450v2_007536 [Rhodotorula kratochvilovae]
MPLTAASEGVAPSAPPSSLPAPTASTSKHPFNPCATGPSFPLTFSPGQARHARRPSRAERYEAIVSSAREVLERGERRSSVEGGEGIGLGLSGGSTSSRDGGRRSRLEDVAGPPVEEQDWQDAVRSLLKVVDGMSQQLATHDDLAAQLKIAQSNLALAETHSEFLEDTLRRRESRSSVSQGMTRHHSGTTMHPPPLPQARRGSGDTATNSGSSGGLFGLGLAGDGDGSTGAKGFFRLPSKRKPTPSNASIASASTANSMPPPDAPFSQGLRSVSSSPHLNETSPNPGGSPTDQPRFSTSTTASSNDDPSLASLINGAGKSPTQLSGEVFALQTQVSSLETECAALRSNNTSLKRSNETLVGKCAELEKTKEDLMSELENLSVELFSEANTLVATERKARAKSDEEVERLKAEVDSLNSQLASLRQELASYPVGLGVTSPELPALPHSAPTTPSVPYSETLQTYSASPARMPSPAHADVDRPISVASVGSTTSSRRWFPFSRASTHATAPEPPKPSVPSRSASHPAPPGTLQPPAMARGDSGSSYLSDASAASFFSTLSGPALSASSSVYERSPGPELERRATAPSLKGKEKARELDLGIIIPPGMSLCADGMVRTDSEGGRTAGVKTPVTARAMHALDAAVQQPLPTSPLYSPGIVPGVPASTVASMVSSPPLPPLPPSTPMPSVSIPGVQDESTPVPDRAPAVFAGPRLRPPRNIDAPRPLAIHTNVTPPMLAGGFSHPVDPSLIGGPTAAEMTAASKSPKSPNELRWNKVAGTIDSRGPKPRSNSHSGAGAGAGGGSRRERENLPPSPALPDGFSQQQQAAPAAPRPADSRAPPRPVQQQRPDPPEPRAKAPSPTPITARLRLDTSAASLAPTPGSASQRAQSARPSSARDAAPRPPLGRAGSSNSAVPFPTVSTAQAAAASGPASAAPTTRPSYLRANSSSSMRSGRPVSPGASASGLTPSTSASSLASRSSASSGGGLLPPSSGASSTSRAVSPDGTNAVEDLESLMQSIVEMSEGLFEKDEEERRAPPVAGGAR